MVTLNSYIKNRTYWNMFSNAKRSFGPCYHLNLNLEIIGQTEIIIKYYQNETSIVFVDLFQIIWTFFDRSALIKMDHQGREQQLTKVKAKKPNLPCQIANKQTFLLH